MLKDRESMYSEANQVGAQQETLQDLSYTFAAALSEISGSESLQRERFIELSDPYCASSDLSGGYNESMFRLGSQSTNT